MSQEKIAKIYVDLDSLLDTRLGTLALISTDFAFDVTTSKDYYVREEDLFQTEAAGKLSKELFTQVHTARRAEVVRNSLRTRIPDFVLKLATNLFFHALSTPWQSGVEVEVNSFPYVLSDEEAKELLASMAALFDANFTIRLVNKRYEDLTIEYVRENYRAMVMYTYHEWMNLHSKDLQKKPLKDLSLYVPRLYYIKKPTREELVEFAKNNQDVFTFHQAAMRPFVMIQHMPIALFCAHTPANLEAYLDE